VDNPDIPMSPSDPRYQAKLANVKEQYYQFIHHRADVRKIINVEINPAAGDDKYHNFHIKLTREEGFTDERPVCSLSVFGSSELLEIGSILREKQSYTRAELAFMKRMKTKFDQKMQMEVSLGLRDRSPSSPHKRKATEEASGHVSKR